MTGTMNLLPLRTGSPREMEPAIGCVTDCGAARGGSEAGAGPLTVTALPPVVLPADGTTEVMVTGIGAAVTFTFADFASEQLVDVVTVTLSVSVPTAPAVKVMLAVPLPAVMVPPLIDQL